MPDDALAVGEGGRGVEGAGAPPVAVAGDDVLDRRAPLDGFGHVDLLHDPRLLSWYSPATISARPLSRGSNIPIGTVERIAYAGSPTRDHAARYPATNVHAGAGRTPKANRDSRATRKRRTVG